MASYDWDADWARGIQAAPLDQFDTAVTELRQLWADLGDHLGRTERVVEVTRVRWGSLAYDLVNYCSVFREVHLYALRIHSAEAMWVSADPAYAIRRAFKPDELTSPEGLRKLAQAEFDARGGEEGMRRYFEEMSHWLEVTGEASGRLKVAYKGLFWFVRAYQDAVYRILHELVHGTRSGRYASMKYAAERPGNEVAKLLAREEAHLSPLVQRVEGKTRRYQGRR